MVKSAFQSLDCITYINVFPIEGFVKNRHFQILRPRWRVLIWIFFAFGFIPFQLAVTFYYLYIELTKPRDDSDSIKTAYVLSLIFVGAFGSMGFVLNLHTALRFHVMVEAMNQGFFLDDFFQSKLTRFFWYSHYIRKPHFRSIIFGISYLKRAKIETFYIRKA